MASDDKTKKGGKGGAIVSIAALTIVAAAGGGLMGKMLVGRGTHQPTAKAETKASPYAGDVEVKELPPIVTNLADPSEARVRLQVAMVYPKTGVENATLLGARINDDIIAFLKTLTIGQLEGSGGLRALREDLNERAAVRSEGKVRELVIEALVVQ